MIPSLLLAALVGLMPPASVKVVALGASFGYTVMARISLLIGRFYFLLHDWPPIIR